MISLLYSVTKCDVTTSKPIYNLFPPPKKKNIKNVLIIADLKKMLLLISGLLILYVAHNSIRKKRVSLAA